MSHITYEWVTSHMNESRHTWLLCMPALRRGNMKVPTSISQHLSICTKSLFICIADDYLRTAPPGAERIKSVINLSYQKNDNFGSDRYWTRSSHQHSGFLWTFPPVAWLIPMGYDSFMCDVTHLYHIGMSHAMHGYTHGCSVMHEWVISHIK